jgi:hypothetical protein
MLILSGGWLLIKAAGSAGTFYHSSLHTGTGETHVPLSFCASPVPVVVRTMLEGTCKEAGPLQHTSYAPSG